MAGWTAVIYGSDTLNTEALPSTSVLASLATTSLVTVDLTWANPNPQLEGDEIIYNDGTARGANHFRTLYEFRIKNKRFPTANTSTESYFNTSILTKKYKWIYLGTYPIQPAAILNSLPTFQKAIPISITGIQVNESDGWKEIVYQAKCRDKDV